MAEWIEDSKDVGDEFREVNKRIQGEAQEHVEDSCDYLKGNNEETD